MEIDYMFVDRTPPQRMTPNSAGIDLPADQDVIIKPGDREIIPTGIAVALPPGSVGLVCSRSGLAWREGLCVLNSPGVIDADYRGQIYVIMANMSKVERKISRGDRIAQLVCVPCLMWGMRQVETLPPSGSRGTDGIGSTGVSSEQSEQPDAQG